MMNGKIALCFLIVCLIAVISVNANNKGDGHNIVLQGKCGDSMVLSGGGKKGKGGENIVIKDGNCCCGDSWDSWDGW